MTTLSDQQASQLLRNFGDRWWRLNNLYYIKDKYGRKVLFKPNAVQADLDDNLHNLNIVLKSRQHGVTTWACIRALDMCLFRAGTQAGIVAHTAGDAAKFFRQKVLYAYDNLPDWMKRQRPVVRRDMRDGILELANGSSIEVSVSHRGGTLQFLHISEYGPMCAMFPERAGEVSSGALNTVAPGNIVVIESTAYGSTGDYYDRCQTAMELDRRVKAEVETLTSLDYKFHFYPWFWDPVNTLAEDEAARVTIPANDSAYFEKLELETGYTFSLGQKAWYVKKSAEQRDKMLREHPSTPDEAFAASTEGAYYGRDLAEAAAQGRILDLPIIPTSPVYTFWDIGRSDATCIWLMQENGPWFDFIDYYEASHEQVAHFVRHLMRRQQELGIVYAPRTAHYWPHDGNNVDWSAGEGKTRKQVAEGMGLTGINVGERIDDVSVGIDMVRQLLPRCRFHKTNCGPQKSGESRGGIEVLKNYRKAWNTKTETFHDYPLHDWASHGADAFREFAQSFRSQTGRPAATRRPAAHDSWKTA